MAIIALLAYPVSALTLPVSTLQLAVTGVFTLLLAVLAGIIYVLKLKRDGALVLVVFCCITLVTVSAISGGIMSPIVLMFPGLPLMANLLLRVPAGWMVSIFLGIFILYDGWSQYPLTEDPQFAITFYTQIGWVVIGILFSASLSALFCIENARLTRALRHLASIDYLTELPNRRTIENTLDTECNLARERETLLSLVMIDIDHFKRYNDVNGHARGDECLKRITEHLQDKLGSKDIFIGRYGGEEFIVILPDTSSEQAAVISEQLRADVESLNASADEPLTITLGVYTTAGDQISSAQSLISKADEALYEGKAEGRNRVIAKMHPA